MVVPKSLPTQETSLARSLGVDEQTVDHPNPWKDLMKTLNMEHNLETIFVLKAQDVNKALEKLDKEG